MKIGLDVDMQTNISEGYMIAEFKKREIYNKGVFNPDADIRFYCHLPDYCLMDVYGSYKPIGVSTVHTDTTYTANDLYKLYLDNKDGIDSMIGDSHKIPTNEYESLYLASDIDSYCGLE